MLITRHLSYHKGRGVDVVSHRFSMLLSFIGSVARVLSLGLTISSWAFIPAYGQQVTGTVLDASTGVPIASALVQVIGSDSVVLRAVLSDLDGSFTISRPVPGELSLRVVQLGYVESWVRWPADAARPLIAHLYPKPVSLPEVSVQTEPENAWLRRTGFYERERLGLGTFITRAEIDTEHSTANRTGDILRKVTRLKVEEQADQEVLLVRSSTDIRGLPCPASVFVEGILVGRAVPRMHPDNIEAIEIYAGVAQIPVQYAGAEAGCGVVLIWLRAG